MPYDLWPKMAAIDPGFWVVCKTVLWKKVNNVCTCYSFSLWSRKRAVRTSLPRLVNGSAGSQMLRSLVPCSQVFSWNPGQNLGSEVSRWMRCNFFDMCWDGRLLSTSSISQVSILFCLFVSQTILWYMSNYVLWWMLKTICMCI